MDEEFFIKCHEELVDEYMENNPNASWEEAYDTTTELVYGYAVDKMADMIDFYHDREKDNLIKKSS